MNTIWNTLDSTKTQEVINAGIQFIKNNQQLFKTEFHKVTRSKRTIELYWTDTPRTVDTSQYALGFASKITGNAKLVLDAVKDDLLLQHIDFKVKNFRSNGAYPELKIPTAVI
jgi:ribulose 1,5-bisphosphate carboxylase large subunit-like protein